MKMKLLALVVTGVFLATSSGRANEYARNEVLRVTSLRACEHLSASGWTMAKELELAGVTESEWIEATTTLVEEELTRWTDGDLAGSVSMLRQLRPLCKGHADEPVRNKARHQSEELEYSLREEGRRLRRFVILLRNAVHPNEAALCVVARIVREVPRESKAVETACSAWVHLALMSKEKSRFAELGNWVLCSLGPDSPELLCICHALWKEGLSPINPRQEQVVEVSRWLLSIAEQFQKASSAEDFDLCAAGEVYYDKSVMRTDASRLPGLAGWLGSLQRKHLAERFSFSELEDSSRLDLRAASELATEDSELTDLRQVYGDWTKEKTED